jgi:hypothetical protein
MRPIASRARPTNGSANATGIYGGLSSRDSSRLVRLCGLITNISKPANSHNGRLCIHNGKLRLIRWQPGVDCQIWTRREAAAGKDVRRTPYFYTLPLMIDLILMSPPYSCSSTARKSHCSSYESRLGLSHLLCIPRGITERGY